MMLNIHTGRGVPHVPNEDILILVSSLHHLAANGVRFIFTNQHAYPQAAEFFNDTSDLDQIDWPLLQSRDFQHNPEDPAKKERYQAEALAWRIVPLGALQGVACYSQAVEKELKLQLDARGLTLKTGVQPNWYFS